MHLIVDPSRKYELPTGVAPVLGVPLTTTIANNQQVIAGVSGKKIKVMGLLAQSNGATLGFFSLKSASGGTVIFGPFAPPSNTTGTYLQLDIADVGYCETNVGEGLFVDVSTAVVILFVNYLVYTP